MTDTTRVLAPRGPQWLGGRGGVVARTVMLMSSWKSPLEWKNGLVEMSDAKKVWLKLWKSATPCDDPPPPEVVEAIEPNLDSPKAFMHMMAYAQRSEGRKLYAAMRYLQLVPLPGEPVPGED